MSALVMLLAGCSEADEANFDSDNSAKSAVTDEGSNSPYLPKLKGPSCEPGDESPAACEWAASMDAIIWANILNVEPSQEWRVRNENGFEVIGQCDSGAPGIEVTLEVEDVLYGDQLPSELTVFIGGSVAETWLVQPKEDGDGGVAWKELGASEADEEAPLKGGGFGIAMHYLKDEGVWSTVGERLFLAESSDDSDELHVTFQQPRGERTCPMSPQPQEFNGIAVSDFQTQVGECDETDAAQERKDLVQQHKFKDPALTFTGICWDEGSADKPDCMTDTDCERAEVCTSGTCEGA